MQHAKQQKKEDGRPSLTSTTSTYFTSTTKHEEAGQGKARIRRLMIGLALGVGRFEMDVRKRKSWENGKMAKCG